MNLEKDVDTHETIIEGYAPESASIVYIVRKRSAEPLGFQLMACDVIQRLESATFLQLRDRENPLSPPFVINEREVHQKWTSALRVCEREITFRGHERAKMKGYIEAVTAFRTYHSSREQLLAEQIRTEIEEERISTTNETSVIAP